MNGNVSIAVYIAIAATFIAVYSEIHSARNRIENNKYVNALGTFKNVSKCKVRKSEMIAAVRVKNIDLVDMSVIDELLVNSNNNILELSYANRDCK